MFITSSSAYSYRERETPKKKGEDELYKEKEGRTRVRGVKYEKFKFHRGSDDDCHTTTVFYFIRDDSTQRSDGALGEEKGKKSNWIKTKLGMTWLLIGCSRNLEVGNLSKQGLFPEIDTLKRRGGNLSFDFHLKLL